jgi:acylpyruvate hydrolase
MRVTTVRTAAGNRAARLEDDSLVILPFSDVGELLATGDDWRERASAQNGPVIPLEGANLAPLIPRPEKIFCVGLNYRDHAAEANLEVPDHPMLFAKYARSLVGPNDDLELPKVSTKVDWELELAVVIGTAVRYVDESQAAEAVAGYTIANDISMRDWQMHTSQFLPGKTFEASTPIGPYLTTPDEVDHASALAMRLSVDGETMQSSSTDQLIFSVPELIAYISCVITLVPGDVILTGTSGGVGHKRTPPQYLRPGSVIEASIDGLGVQLNRCVPEVGGQS